MPKLEEMNKPKIAIFIDQLVLGGVQKDATEEVRMLRKLGFDAQLIALMRQGFKPEFKRIVKDISYEFLSDRYPKLLGRSFKFPIFSFFSTLHLLSPFLAPFFVKKGEWDIIVGHGTTTCLTTLSLKKTRSIPYVAVIHDPMEYILKQVYKETLLKAFFGILSPLLFVIEKAIIGNARSVMVVSRIHAPFIKKTYQIEPTILTAGANPLKKLPSRRQNFLLSVSRWEIGKNPLLLLKILENTPNTSLKIAGSWTRNEDLLWFKKQIKKLNLQKRVKIISPVSDKELSRLYSQALAWVHPNFEAFGVGGLEAAAHGCPIIIPKGSGVTEIFEDQKDGIFPKKATLSDFLPAVKTLLANPTKATQMGKSAYNKAKNHSWKNHTKKLISIINESHLLLQKTIIALETGHSSESYLAGGDKLLEKMAYYFKDSLKIKVIVPAIGTKHWEESKLKNVELLILKRTIFDNNPSPTWVFFAYLARIWYSFWKLRRAKNVGILYSSTNVLPDVAPAFFFKLTHPKTIWVARVHHLITSPQKRPGRLMVNLVSYGMQFISRLMIKSQSDLTIALNNQLAKTLTKQGFQKDRITVLGAGIDYQKIEKVKVGKNKKYDAIFVGRIHPSKGIYDLVEIWKIVASQRPEAHAIIVGEGAPQEKAKLISKIKKAGISNNLKIAGYLSDKKLIASLKSSMIFVFCDHEAGWGLAIGEAMAAGLPVVGYNLDIFGDVYKQGYNLVPLGDTKHFAKKVIHLLDNQNDYLKLKRDALSQARRLSWQQTSLKFQQIVTKLI